MLHGDIEVGDFVKDTRSSDNHSPFKVIALSEKRFVVEIGFNEKTHVRMTRTYRKEDGRSVGDKRNITYVRRVPTSDAKGVVGITQAKPEVKP